MATATLKETITREVTLVLSEDEASNLYALLSNGVDYSSIWQGMKMNAIGRALQGARIRGTDVNFTSVARASKEQRVL